MDGHVRDKIEQISEKTLIPIGGIVVVAMVVLWVATVANKSKEHEVRFGKNEKVIDRIITRQERDRADSYALHVHDIKEVSSMQWERTKRLFDQLNSNKDRTTKELSEINKRLSRIEGALTK